MSGGVGDSGGEGEATQPAYDGGDHLLIPANVGEEWRGGREGGGGEGGGREGEREEEEGREWRGERERVRK